MGCAPSGNRQGSGSSDDIVPYPLYGAWESSCDVTRAEPGLVPATGVDPPPYTEEAMEGHISLMRGQSPVKPSVSREAWPEPDRESHVNVSSTPHTSQSQLGVAEPRREGRGTSPRRSSHVSRPSSAASTELAWASSPPRTADSSHHELRPLHRSVSAASSCGEQAEQLSELCLFPPRQLARPHSPRPHRRGTYPFLLVDPSQVSQEMQINPFPPRRTHTVPPLRGNFPEDPSALPPDQLGRMTDPLAYSRPPPGSYQQFVLPPIGPHPLIVPAPSHRLPPLHSDEQQQILTGSGGLREAKRRQHRKRMKRRTLTWHGGELQGGGVAWGELQGGGVAWGEGVYREPLLLPTAQ